MTRPITNDIARPRPMGTPVEQDRTLPAPRRRVRRLAITIPLLLFLALAGSYAASPLATAWSIREAVRNGNSDYLRTAVDWPRIKETLKHSMFRYAIRPAGDLPSDSSASGGSETASVAAPPPGLWQRIKESYGRSVVEGMVENYVTPEGLPKLFAYRTSYNRTLGRAPLVAEDAPLLDRVRNEWSRLRTARFLSPTRFAIEIDDRYEEGRRIAGVLELGMWNAELGWRLVSLEVKGERKTSRSTPGSSAPSRLAALP
ncbi:MAG: DUF2939 domain-containing protein [Hyphomicrobiaceae bacterium]|nr:DUF2939 domain-containing protein [Hyphomicrobiaceae bacterium]